MEKDAIDFAREKEQLAKKLDTREYAESTIRLDNDGRNPYMRDYARVLYCSSFRRLQGKMQLLAVNEARFNRNRLTHSLEVAQIARGLATSLQLEDTVVSETCALIHDIGNPPFGHHGEEILNQLTGEQGGYEGNAQAFRIVRSLEKKHPASPGLNLTGRTLWGIAKYFKTRSEDQSKFLYNEDHSYLKGILDKAGITDKKSIDAQIMDLSDEIAYAAHDLEDALSANLLAIGELIHEFHISENFKEAGDTLAGIVKEVQSYAMSSHSLKTSEEYSMVFRKELTSRIVNTLVDDIGLVNNQTEIGYKNLENLALGLKKLTFKTVLRKNHIQEYEIRGEKVLRGLFDIYTNKNINKNNRLLPAELRNLDSPKERLVCDYLSGMMDAFAANEYIKYYGESNYQQLKLQPSL